MVVARASTVKSAYNVKNPFRKRKTPRQGMGKVSRSDLFFAKGI